jgi:hypothetical protein
MENQSEPLFEVALFHNESICSIPGIHWRINGAPAPCDPRCIRCNATSYQIPYRLNFFNLTESSFRETEVQFYAPSLEVCLFLFTKSE